jgi:hypothetical protein
VWCSTIARLVAASPIASFVLLLTGLRSATNKEPTSAHLRHSRDQLRALLYSHAARTYVLWRFNTDNIFSGVWFLGRFLMLGKLRAPPLGVVCSPSPPVTTNKHIPLTLQSNYYNTRALGIYFLSCFFKRDWILFHCEERPTLSSAVFSLSKMRVFPSSQL